MLRSACLAAVTLTLVSTAFAQVSDIVSAPEARSRSKGHLVLQYRLTTTDESLDSRYVHNFKATYGVGYGVEVGWENDFLGNAKVGGKYQFFTSADKTMAAAVGISDIGDANQTFGAVEKKYNGFTFTAGIITNDSQGFTGAKSGWYDRFKYSADYLGNSRGKLSLRTQIKINDQFDFDVRMYIPNNSNKPNTYRFGINYSYKF